MNNTIYTLVEIRLASPGATTPFQSIALKDGEIDGKRGMTKGHEKDTGIIGLTGAGIARLQQDHTQAHKIVAVLTAFYPR